MTASCHARYGLLTRFLRVSWLPFVMTGLAQGSITGLDDRCGCYHPRDAVLYKDKLEVPELSVLLPAPVDNC